MATSGSSEGGFSGRAGFVLRVGIARIDVVNSTTNRWRVNVQAINRSGYVSFDLTARPWSIGGTFSQAGSWVPDFRSGDVITIWSADVNVSTNSDGYDTISWSASAGPAGIFGSASTSGSFSANRIPQVPSGIGAPVRRDAATTSSVTWGFPAPDDNGGSSIERYRAQLATGAGFGTIIDTRTFLPDDRANQTWSGLDPAEDYYVRYRVENSVGASGWSAIVGATTKMAVPGRLTGVAASNIGPSTTTLTWSAPTDNGGGTITGYIIQRATNSAFTDDLTEFSQGTTRSRTFTDLTPSTTYYYRVASVNAAGRSYFSTPAISATTISGAYVSVNGSWRGAGIFVSDGTDWQPATIAVSDGTSWVDAN